MYHDAIDSRILIPYNECQTIFYNQHDCPHFPGNLAG